MTTVRPLSFILLLTLVHCGGTVAGGALPPDSGSPDGGVVPNPSPQCPGSPSQPVGRPQSETCAVTPVFPPFDAGNVACSTLADCQDSGAPETASYQACRGGQCVFDQCLTDSDCATGSACICANEIQGNAIHFNECLPTQCRVDTDCGAGQVCSGSNGSYCGGLTGYYCHSAADTCKTDTDCCGGDSGEPSPTQCAYDPTLGHFTCQAVSVCAG